MDESGLISVEQLSKMRKNDLVVLVSTLLKKRIESLQNIGAERDLYARHVRQLEEREKDLSLSLRQERDQRNAWKDEIEKLKKEIRAANDDFRNERHRRQALEQKLKTRKRTPKPKALRLLVATCETHLL